MTAIPPAIQRQLDTASFADIHPALMKAVHIGAFTILDLFDTLEWFRGAADWTAWRAFLCALYALPMTPQEFAIYQHCTGRTEPPKEPAREFWVPTGRRSRKSAIAALIAVFEGGFRDYTPYLAPGERAVIPIIGKNIEEAKQIASYCKAILSDEALSYLLEDEPIEETIKLVTHVDLRIRPASITAGRGKTTPLALLDEVAFFPVEGSAVPDVEVVRAIRPGMATIPFAKLGGLSSPWGQRGLLYENYKAHYGVNQSRILVWKADTLRMHDTPQLRAEIENAYAKDPVAAAAEYGADFREDTDAFVLERVLEAAIKKGRLEVAPVEGRNYFAFIDPSGGSNDSLAMAIAHFEADLVALPVLPAVGRLVTEDEVQRAIDEAKRLPGKAVLDCVREWRAPFDPELVTAECADELKRYGLHKAIGDKYGGKWVASGFHRYGINFGWSQTTKNEIYIEFLPLLNMGQVELLDKPVIKAQFLVLDRRVARGGRETIDHAPGAHDDVANSVAGAAVLAKTWGPRMRAPKKELPPATTTTEIMRRRLAEMLKGPSPGRNIHRRRR